MVLSTLFVGLAFQVIGKVQALPKPSKKDTLWYPSQPEGLDNLAQEELLSQQAIIKALFFITNRPEEVVYTPPTKVTPVVKAVPEEPVDEDFLNDAKVTLIAYDDNGGGHVAFIKKGFKPSHPYFENDDLMTSPAARVSRIFRDHVILEDERGRRQTLYLGEGEQQARGGKNTRGGGGASSPVKRVGATPKAATPKPEVKPEKEPVVTEVPAVPKQRFVPTWRKTTENEDYGINVVEYSPTPDGSRRFAINDKDLKTLQSQPLRLMSEVLPSTAYDGSGKPMGIRLDFISDNPLAKSYGVQDGDIVTHLNSKPIADENQAMGIYESLDGKQRTVPVTIKRGDKSFIVILEMDDFPSAPKR